MNETIRNLKEALEKQHEAIQETLRVCKEYLDNEVVAENISTENLNRE